jgi:hypothetical protein
MLVKSLILGSDKGLLEERRNTMERSDVMNVPGILERDGQRSAMAVQELRFRQIRGVRDQGGGAWLQGRPRAPG